LFHTLLGSSTATFLEKWIKHLADSIVEGSKCDKPFHFLTKMGQKPELTIVRGKALEGEDNEEDDSGEEGEGERGRGRGRGKGKDDEQKKTPRKCGRPPGRTTKKWKSCETITSDEESANSSGAPSDNELSDEMSPSPPSKKKQRLVQISFATGSKSSFLPGHQKKKSQPSQP
jgi:hypothetical protein